MSDETSPNEKLEVGKETPEKEPGEQPSTGTETKQSETGSGSTPGTPTKSDRQRTAAGEIPSPPPVPDGEHPLEHSYCFWFGKRHKNTHFASPEDYKAHLKLVGCFSSVEQFWSYYSHMLRPHHLIQSRVRGAEESFEFCDYHMFKNGIIPIWEEEANKNGGCFTLTFTNTPAIHVSKFWENVLLAIIGEQFLVGDEICGAVVAMRGTHFADRAKQVPNSHKISVWNRTAKQEMIKTRIRDYLTRLAPPEIMSNPGCYKIHYTQFWPKERERDTGVQGHGGGFRPNDRFFPQNRNFGSYGPNIRNDRSFGRPGGGRFFFHRGGGGGGSDGSRY